MRLGIDFGTTHTVVAAEDRGNYPVLGFADEDGDVFEFFPSVVAARGGDVRYGFAALAAAERDGFTLLRSFKRLVSDAGATQDLIVTVGDTELAWADLLRGFLEALREAVLRGSNLPGRKKGTTPELDAVVGVPANAHGTQRFLTLEAFKSAGFTVRALLNEPSAAAFEYTHRHRDTLSSRREHVVVYDLGGGTFDASAVRIHGRTHEVVATAGIERLGGDDFDEVLCNLVLDATRSSTRGQLSAAARAQLLDRCREAKDRLNPSSRRVVIETAEILDRPEVSIAADAFYDFSAPLVLRTLDALDPVLRKLAPEEAQDPLVEVAGIYVVGGASALPSIGRTLRGRFGRRVHRSPYPSAATAIGLAIAADDDAGFAIADRFARTFGVFRELQAGREVTLDPIFTADDAVPGATDAPVVRRRRYRAAHDIGHFRFVEHAARGAGTPIGDVAPCGELLVAFDPALRGHRDLRGRSVRRFDGEGPLIEEQYVLDAHGIVSVTIRDLENDYAVEGAIAPAGSVR